MSPTIRIDDEVYKWLQSQAVPFEDNPNSVLRRLAGLDGKLAGGARSGGLAPAKSSSLGLPQGSTGMAESNQAMTSEGKPVVENPSVRAKSARRLPLTTGRALLKRWKLPVKQARFHRDGSWYEELTEFPAAYCDCNGFIVFSTEQDVQRTPGLHVEPSRQVWVPSGISALPAYQRVDDPVRDTKRPQDLT